MLVTAWLYIAAGDRKSAGFSILQLLVALVVLGILTAVAIPGFQMYIERAQQARAVGELGEIELAIHEFSSANDGQLPADLAAVGLAGATDPWGGNWIYINLGLGGSPRTDQNGDPVNTDYDLYSSGPDGATALSLTAGDSADDVIRGSDGGFVGAVEDYSRLN